MQHNKLYTILFATSITIIASLFLATASTQLRAKQEFNKELDRKKKILECLGLDVDSYSMEAVINTYEKGIKGIVTTLDGEKVEIYFNDSGSPALLKDPSDFNSIFVVMPMKG